MHKYNLDEGNLLHLIMHLHLLLIFKKLKFIISTTMIYYNKQSECTYDLYKDVL